MALQSKQQKVGDFGKKGALKKDGYGSGGPPDIVIGNKPGKVGKVGYSGPNVARAEK